MISEIIAGDSGRLCRRMLVSGRVSLSPRGGRGGRGKAVFVAALVGRCRQVDMARDSVTSAALGGQSKGQYRSNRHPQRWPFGNTVGDVVPDQC